MMFTKVVLFAVLAACGVQSKQATSPDVQLGGDPAENAKAVAAAREWLDRQMEMQRQMQAASNQATSPDEPIDGQPDETPVEEGQYFCCQSLDPKSPSGDGCLGINVTQVVACNKVLYCPGAYTNDEGKVNCYT